MRLLVVEDEGLVLMTLVDMLEDLGHEVRHEASNIAVTSVGKRQRWRKQQNGNSKHDTHSEPRVFMGQCTEQPALRDSVAVLQRCCKWPGRNGACIAVVQQSGQMHWLQPLAKTNWRSGGSANQIDGQQ